MLDSERNRGAGEKGQQWVLGVPSSSQPVQANGPDTLPPTSSAVARRGRRRGGGGHPIGYGGLCTVGVERSKYELSCSEADMMPAGLR